MNAIEIKNLCKYYKDVKAVDDLSLCIKEGELFSLLGVNGAGKTTTIKMLSCLINPTAGDAILGGFSVLTESQKVKEITNASPQETAIAPNLTVYENLKFIGGIYDIPSNDLDNEVNKIIDSFELSSIRNKRAKKLSGGWQRRLSIAMALISKPKILFLDEPTLGLDVIARRELWNIISGLKGKITIILTTHYLEEAEALSDNIGIMANGRLKALGSPSELKALTGKSNFEDAFIDLVTAKVEVKK